MILADINLLLYAHDKNSRFHRESMAWWSDCLSGSQPVFLCAPVLFGFIRISTNGRLYPSPLTVEQAAGLVSEWLAQSMVQFTETTRQDVDVALGFLTSAGVRGNLTTDAELAAISVRLGATIHTNDTDFAAFPLVRWHNPLQSKPKR